MSGGRFTATILPMVLLGSWLLGCGQELAFSFRTQRCPEQARSPFRYVIIHNDEIEGVAPDGNKGRIRVVNVLLDRRAFSEATLRQLFKLLSNRFPKSERVFIHVYTDLDDVDTPEEADQAAPSGRCDSLRGDKSAWAMYNRSKEYEGFDYSTNDPGSAVKTVRLRGK